MAIVNISYKKDEEIVQENIETSSDKFLQILREQLDILKIELAPKGAKEGFIGNIKNYVFKEKGDFVEKPVEFLIKDNKIHISNVGDISVRGYDVIKSPTASKYGDMLAVSTKSKIIVPDDKRTTNDLVYAIKTTQGFNEELLDELETEPDNKKEDSVENVETEEKAKDAINPTTRK